MSNATNGDVLVLGGTGELGSEVAKALVTAGKSVTVLARLTSNRALLDGLNVSYVTGDMLSEADMERVFTSASYGAVVDASSGPYRGMEDATHDLLAAQTFYEDSQKIVSKWAAATGVQHFILHGTVGAGNSAHLVNDEHVFEVQRLALASKNAAEEILKNSGVTYTIIRHLTILPMPQKESGKARLSKDLTEVGAVTRDGLARLTLDCIDNTDCRNEIFHAMDDEVALPTEIAALWKLALKPEYLPVYVNAT